MGLTISYGIKEHSVLNLVCSESLVSVVQKEDIELQKLSDMAFTQWFMPSNLPVQTCKIGCYIKGRIKACDFWRVGWGGDWSLWPGASREKVNTVKRKFSSFHGSCQSGLDYWSINFGYLPIATKAYSKSLSRIQNSFIRFQPNEQWKCKSITKDLRGDKWEIESLKQWILSFLNNQLYLSFWICILNILYINNHIISLNCIWLSIREKSWNSCG